MTFDTPSASAARATLWFDRSRACKKARFSSSLSGKIGVSGALVIGTAARISPADGAPGARKRPTRRVARRSRTIASGASKLTSASMTFASSRMLPGQS